MVALISFMSLSFQQITLVSGRFRGVDITYVTLRTLWGGFITIGFRLVFPPAGFIALF